MKNVMKLSALVLVLSGLFSSAQAVPTYTITNLAGLGGNYSAAYGINELGQVVGTSCNATGCNTSTPDSKYNAVVWSNTGVITNLGFTGAARAINNYGEVVGETGTGFSKPQSPNGRAFYWNNTYAAGTYRDLGTHYSDGSGGYYGYSGAFDINDAGAITGFAYTDASFPFGIQGGSISTFSKGFVARRNNNFALEDIGCVDNNYDCYSRGQGINESTQIAGRASDTDFSGNKQATYWDWDGANPAAQFAPVLTQAYSTMEDINESGLMVGVSSSDPSGFNLQATIWTGGNASLLNNTAGFDKSYAWALNDSNSIVGYMTQAGTVNNRAFIYRDGSMYDLSALVVDGIRSAGFNTLEMAYDINNKGQIVGYGRLKGGAYGAFLLTEVVTVPVPSAAWMMGSALLGLAGLARNKKNRK